MTPVVRALARLTRDSHGGVAMIFVLVVVALIAATGMAVDYAQAMRDRTVLQGASDAAALAASRTAADYLAANGWSTAGASQAATLGIAAAKASFAANTTNVVLKGTPTLTPTMAITSAQDISANVTVTASAPTSLLGVIGIGSIDLSAAATAKASLPVSYYQFVFLVDVSGSMAIGGTSADIAKLQGSAQFGYCGFACHDPNHYNSATDYRVLAKTKGINLKIDYVNTAIQTFFTALDGALTKAGANSTTSIYTYATGFNTLVANATTISAATSAAAAIDVEGVGTAASNWGYTKTAAALGSLKNALKNVGDGTTASARKTYVVFLTDGIEDLPGTCSVYGRCTDVNYATACSAIKTAGATLISIEATYPVVPNDAQYTQIVAPYAAQLPATLKSCASGAQWYFAASDGPAIQSAMSSIVSQIANTLRLSD